MKMIKKVSTIVTFTLVAMLAVSGLTATANGEGGKETKQETKQVDSGTEGSAGEKVNINTANLEALITLPRVGPVIAKRIIEFREQHGKFNKPEELMNVKGIGEKTFAKLAPLISL